ncbi:hypothetical protein LX32DRAFT_165257 [Colletotrichum zoysiae]|uniref:Uncharacterized protein n=1 Tax=Colletotrichum zoysiae TaxID=1216348 RepID=A0AAD9LUX1_9PEZI|nr:hypothetical protein LX32DRAFT_165257 [Colletotrichum zoysiae]
MSRLCSVLCFYHVYLSFISLLMPALIFPPCPFTVWVGEGLNRHLRFLNQRDFDARMGIDCGLRSASAHCALTLLN